MIKKHFTITEIGSIRFYIGLVLGAGYAIILNLLLQLFRKTFHFVNADYGTTLINLNYQTLSFYDSFLMVFWQQVLLFVLLHIIG